MAGALKEGAEGQCVKRLAGTRALWATSAVL